MTRDKNIKVDEEEHAMLDDVAAEWLGSPDPRQTPYGYSIRRLAEEDLSELEPQESEKMSTGERMDTVRVHSYEYELLREVAIRRFGTPDIPFGQIVRILTNNKLNDDEVTEFDPDEHQERVSNITGLEDIERRAEEHNKKKQTA